MALPWGREGPEQEVDKYVQIQKNLKGNKKNKQRERKGGREGGGEGGRTTSGEELNDK